MTDFLSTAVRFPAIVFTVPLLVVVAYWLLALVFGAGSDALDGGEHVGAGSGTGGFAQDAAIDCLGQTPLAQLDPHDIPDAQGIRKITELTAIGQVRTNEFQRTAPAPGGATPCSPPSANGCAVDRLGGNHRAVVDVLASEAPRRWCGGHRRQSVRRAPGVCCRAALVAVTGEYRCVHHVAGAA